MKVYIEFKEIKIKDIKGVNTARIYSRNSGMISRYKRLINMEGIKKPFEVIKNENGYYILKNRMKLLAAEMLGYDKVPCLIRDIKIEILLRRFNKIFQLEDENSEIENYKKRLDSSRKNYYEINDL